MSKTNCPKCGTPARIVLIKKAIIRCRINADGSLGAVVSPSRGTGEVAGFECGGGHRWEAMGEAVADVFTAGDD